MAAVGLRPLVIKKEEGVHATAQAKGLVSIEVGVDLKLATGCGEMHATAEVVWVGDDAVDAAQLLEEPHPQRGLKKGEETARGWSHLCLFIDRTLEVLHALLNKAHLCHTATFRRLGQLMMQLVQH
eukprot:CAMPEP_0185284016 /NCGR_PEP_ID=MMETSP1363-20130426/816_1 /TAXON_ID=38817 /ORGANISM="Gephyrocapsa oceanica, Strain RCC1303" /LENGTH=125 /DNA_ID=CAMNT_0027879701 /DNA_START=650 /DNA_END=1027 /DNA_ORIENTATION=+